MDLLKLRLALLLSAIATFICKYIYIVLFERLSGKYLYDIISKSFIAIKFLKI